MSETVENWSLKTPLRTANAAPCNRPQIKQ